MTVEFVDHDGDILTISQTSEPRVASVSVFSDHGNTVVLTLMQSQELWTELGRLIDAHIANQPKNSDTIDQMKHGTRFTYRDAIGRVSKYFRYFGGVVDNNGSRYDDFGVFNTGTIEEVNE